MNVGQRLPDMEDVLRARERISGLVRRTPVLQSEVLNERLGCEVFLKAENLQETGSFKLRGASNRIAALSDPERRAGIVAFSSGNHAQGVARAARRAGVSAKIVMPSDAPTVKAEGVRSDGAEIIAYDRVTESREEIAAAIAERDGRVLVPSYDDPFIIAGQGTAGLEFAEQCSALGVSLDRLVCCVGGGGLIAGISLAFEHLSPDTLVYGAEPEAFDDHRRSLAAGRRLANPPGAGSICDALLSPSPGEITFAINEKRLSGVFGVSDAEVTDSMRFGVRHLKTVIEPGGAAALASVMHHLPGDWRGKKVGVVLTGGNLDAVQLSRILTGQGSFRAI